MAAALGLAAPWTVAAPVGAQLPPGFDPVVTVTPTTDLPATATLHLHAEGFFRDAYVHTLVCKVGEPVDWSCAPAYPPLDGGAPNKTTPDGTLDGDIVVHRRSIAHDGTIVDCTVAPHCFVVLRHNFGGEVETGPIDFDPAAPGPVTSLSIAEPGPYLDFQRVTIAAAGFLESFEGRIVAEICAPAAGACRQLPNPGWTPGPVWHPRVQLRRAIPTPGGAPLDCATVAGGCELRVHDRVDAERVASAPLPFDPTEPFAARPVLVASDLVVEGDGPESALAGPGLLVPDSGRPTDRVSTDTRRGTAQGHAVDYKRRVAEVPGYDRAIGQPPPVPVIGDDLVEGPEWFTLEITDTEGLDPVQGPGLVIIVDDDLPPGSPAVVASAVLAVEGEVAWVPLRLSAPSPVPVTVHVRTERGTAAAGAGDFRRRDLDVTFAPGTTLRRVGVEIADDGMPEPAEWLRLVVTPVSGAPVAQPFGLVGIVDTPDEAPGRSY